MKVLNLYACLGGNRYKWNEVCPEIEVTAVEYDPMLAKLYQERFSNDKVIVADAHQYLLDHYREYDFIWSSPPCPSHSSLRMSQRNRESFIPVYPDMRLYEEVIFLKYHSRCPYVVENVVPYYEPLIPPQKRGRHLYWTNFALPGELGERKLFKNLIEKGSIEQLSEFHDFDIRRYKGDQRLDKIGRNLVDYEVGKNIFKIALGMSVNINHEQGSLFD